MHCKNLFFIDWPHQNVLTLCICIFLPRQLEGRKYDIRTLRRSCRAEWVYSDKIAPKHLWLSLKFCLTIFMTFIKIFRDDMLILPDTFQKQNKHVYWKIASILVKIWWLNCYLSFFLKKINVIKANYIFNKNNAVELRFLYALIRTYSHLDDVKDFPHLIGQTHLTAFICLVQTTFYVDYTVFDTE